MKNKNKGEIKELPLKTKYDDNAKLVIMSSAIDYFVKVVQHGRNYFKLPNHMIKAIRKQHPRVTILASDRWGQ